MTNLGHVNIRGRDYKTVALRVAEFRDRYPIDQGWSIETEITEINAEAVVVKASIVNAENKVIATGHGHERWDASQINATSCVENCETSAIGRALAAAGFGGSEFASANEVENAIHQQAAEKPAKKAPPSSGHSQEWERFAKWLTDTYSSAIESGEPWSSWDEIDAIISSQFKDLEAAGLLMTDEHGEQVCDWDKLRRFTEPALFRVLCQAVKAEYQSKMSETFV